MQLFIAVSLRLKKLIDSNKDLSACELAKRTGIPRATLWKIIYPDLTQIKTIKMYTLQKLVSALGMSLKDFFNDPIFDDVTD